MSTAVAGAKGFRRWASTAREKRVAALEYAVASLVPHLESAGFLWTDRTFDCGGAPAHTINLERELVRGQVDFVQLIFDKHHRARLQVLFGSKEKAPPHRWVRSGALVWKKESASVEYKWWGARWWHFDKDAALMNSVDAVAALLPQLLRFLVDGVAGVNVWQAELRE